MLKPENPESTTYYGVKVICRWYAFFGYKREIVAIREVSDRSRLAGDVTNPLFY